jgi:hypothetical protein
MIQNPCPEPVARMMRSLLPAILLAALSGCDAPTLLPPDAVLPDGSVYHGDVENGRFQGDGMLVYTDGSEYRGEFHDGLMHGQGEITTEDWRYKGEMYRGEMAGEGVYEDKFGKYEGTFANGNFNGQGTYTYSNGDILKGEFADGDPLRGVLTRSGHVYEGEFDGWKFHGQGEYRDEAGSWRYSGEFNHGELTGRGQHHDEEGNVYVGEFDGWMYYGKGVLTRADGSRIEGQFEYDDPSGEVIMISTDKDGKEVRRKGAMYGGEFVAEGEPSPTVRRAALVEKVLTEDHHRLQRALDAVVPENPGKQDIYYLLVGGDGGDSVFVRDVAFARETLHQRFNAEGHGVVLLNDRDYSDYPLATRNNIRRAMAHLAATMNPNEDLLIVHLASHGGQDGALTIRQPGMLLPELQPADYQALLEQVHIPHQVLIVTACHSGHWLDMLASDTNMILASARRDRTSFGCGDASEMTWFTKAVYQEAELALHNPKALFSEVDRRIRAWEEEEGMDEDQRSEPQFHLGQRFIGVSTQASEAATAW